MLNCTFGAKIGFSVLIVSLSVVEAVHNHDSGRCSAGSGGSNNSNQIRRYDNDVAGCNTNFGLADKDQEEQILDALERAGFFQVINETESEYSKYDDDENGDGHRSNGQTSTTTNTDYTSMINNNQTFSKQSVAATVKHFSKSTKKSFAYVTIPENYKFQADSARFIFPQVLHNFETARNLLVEPCPNIDFTWRQEQQQQEPKAARMTTSMTTTSAWVRKFLASRSKDVLFPLPKDYCADHFNHAQLPAVIEKIANRPEMSAASSSTKPYPIYRRAYKLLIADDDGDDHDDGSDDLDEIPDYLEHATEALYLLLHQRFVLSPRGMDMVRRRFLASNQFHDPLFGRCPLLTCRGMPLLPIGDSDHYTGLSRNGDKMTTNITTIFDVRAKRYCASCGRVLYFWDSKVDGCAWGTSFCHLFLMVFPEILEKWNHIRTPKYPEQTHVPRIYGFELYAEQ